MIDDAFLTTCNNHDALLNVNDVSSAGLIFTSSLELENEVLASKQMQNSISAKMVEHNVISANLENDNAFVYNIDRVHWKCDAKLEECSMWYM